MPNFTSLFKQEVARLARKETRVMLESTRKAATQHRSDIAELKREVATLRRKVATLEGREKKRIERGPAVKTAEGKRFAPTWLKAHRKRLGISAADYGRLVGVSAVTVYSWEGGKTKPREKQMAKWVAMRDLGKRQAQRQLELLG